MENLTITEIQARCDALAKAMEEKGVLMPEAGHTIASGGKLYIILCSSASKPAFENGMDWIKTIKSDDPFASAEKYIAALPDPATEGERKFTRALADAIDIATEYSLPDEVVAPVREAVVAVNAALLEGPK